MNENLKIIEQTDEIIICDENGYPYIRINNPNNDNPNVYKIVSDIMLHIDLSEMIQ